MIDLKRRECIAGLRYGIEGMRVGGIRELKISPHLAYGAVGVPGHVPSNAVIRARVELLDVRDPGVRKPEDYPPGKHLFVFHPGEAVRNLPRWQFGLEEDGRCGLLITHPIPGMPWRHLCLSHKEAKLDVEKTMLIFDNVRAIPKLFPKDCFRHEELWADTAEKGNSITRDIASNTLCLTIGVQEQGRWLIYFSLAETSGAVNESILLKQINMMLEDKSGKEISFRS